MHIASAMQNLRAMARRWLPRGGGAARASLGFAAALLAAPMAHAGFTNGDFETGNLTGWTSSDYINNKVGTFPPLTKSHLNLAARGAATPAVVTGVVNAAPGTGTAPDAALPNGKFEIPFQGNYSARVNARGDSGRAGGIYQEATMQLSDVDPVDGKVHVRMALSPVIEAATHPYTDQPYFFIEVRNKTKGTQLFYTFNFSNQPGAPWQKVGSYEFTGWQAIDVAPGNGLLDVGDLVSVEIIAAGCEVGQGGHSGEVYVDTIGPFFAGLSVAATGPTTSKPGDNVTYTYNYGNTSGVMVFDGKVVIKAPQGLVAGASATRPSVSDFRNATYVTSSGATCAQGPVGTLTCDVGTLADKANGSFNITWTVPGDASTASPTNMLNHGDYAMSATGASTVRGPMVQTQLLGSGSSLTDLAVTVTDGVSAVAPNGALTYTVTVTNNGPLPVTGAPLAQTVATGMTVGSWTCAAAGAGSGACSAGAGTGLISPGALTLDIPVGESITLTVQATAGASGNATTAFHVDPPASITDSNTSNNTAGDTNNIGTLHTLAVTKSGTGTGSVVSSTRDLVCDNSASPVCSVAVADGNVKILTAAASPGSIFKGWTSGPCAGTSVNPCTVPAMTGDVTADAEFIKAYIVTPTLSGGGGTIGPNTPQQVEEGGSKVFTLTPGAGRFTVIANPPVGTACTGTLNTSVSPNTYTVTPVTADCGFTVSFVTGVTLTSSVTGGNGTIGPLGASSPLVPGSNSTVYTLTPAPGYAPIVGGTCKGTLDLGANTYTVTNATADCTVVASFTNDPVTVTSAVNGGNGSIDTTGTVNLPRGSNRAYTFTPAPGYYPLVTGNCPGRLVGNTYTVDPVNADCAFAVAFTNQTVNITGTVSSGLGSITPPGTTTVAQGGGLTYIATPGSGNVAVFGGNCPGTRVGNAFTVANAQANCNVDVKFVATAAAVTVVTSVPGGNGTVTTPGQNVAGETVLGLGDSRVWTVTPAPGYVPRLMPGATCTGTLSTTAPYTYTVTNATNCTASFAFVASSTAHAIPTLSEWGMIILTALMALVFVGARRRQMR